MALRYEPQKFDLFISFIKKGYFVQGLFEGMNRFLTDTVFFPVPSSCWFWIVQDASRFLTSTNMFSQ